VLQIRLVQTAKVRSANYVIAATVAKKGSGDVEIAVVTHRALEQPRVAEGQLSVRRKLSASEGPRFELTLSLGAMLSAWAWLQQFD
jgi:hypothetical protein